MSHDPTQTTVCPHCGQPMPRRGLSAGAAATLNYMRKEAPRRGGYMFEGARLSYEAGKYYDAEIAELLAAGAIVPHQDPAKGWVVQDQVP